MAKATFTCAECGNTDTVLGRNRGDADRLAAYREKSGAVCSACYEKARAAQNEAAAAKAAAAAADAGWPSLVGTDKQVRWAETLRAHTLGKAERAKTVAVAIGQLPQREGEAAAAMDRAEKSMMAMDAGQKADALDDAVNLLRLLNTSTKVVAFYDILCGQEKASWWIDFRGTSLESLARKLREEISNHVAANAAPEVPPEVVAAVEEESLLKPGEPASATIAEVTCIGTELRVAMAERNEKFRLLMRGLEFSWAKTHWVRPLGITSGSPTDRAAEITHCLIAAGFMVRLRDNEARKKAINGDFSPEQRRWVTKLNSGSFAGWCCLSWPRTDDLYTPAKRLSGARYADGKIMVPAASILEVADFAEKYHFSMSPGVQTMLSAHREAVARGAVIAHPKQGAPALVETGTVPVKLDVPTDLRVDDELLDRH